MWHLSETHVSFVTSAWSTSLTVRLAMTSHYRENIPGRAITDKFAANACAVLQLCYGWFLTDTQTYSQSSDGASNMLMLIFHFMLYINVLILFQIDYIILASYYILLMIWNDSLFNVSCNGNWGGFLCITSLLINLFLFVSYSYVVVLDNMSSIPIFNYSDQHQHSLVAVVSEIGRCHINLLNYLAGPRTDINCVHNDYNIRMTIAINNYLCFQTLLCADTKHLLSYKAVNLIIMLSVNATVL